jgi:hypothetical protein
LLDLTVVVLVFEPIELGRELMGVKPITLHRADAQERRIYARTRR